jgi:hypothetical protein
MNRDIEALLVYREEHNHDAHKNIIGYLEEKSHLKVDEDMLIKSLEKCSNINEIQSIENLVYKLSNSEIVDLPCYGPLKRLINLKDEYSILEFTDYCVKLCIEEENLELMCEITVLLQDFIDLPFYKNPVGRLMKQLTYVKVPSKWCEISEYQSSNENLYGYKIHNPELSRFDRFVYMIMNHFSD